MKKIEIHIDKTKYDWWCCTRLVDGAGDAGRAAQEIDTWLEDQ